MPKITEIDYSQYKMSKIANYHDSNPQIYTNNLSFFSKCYKDCVNDFADTRLS
jgi:hypothetical protein